MTISALFDQVHLSVCTSFLYADLLGVDISNIKDDVLDNKIGNYLETDFDKESFADMIEDLETKDIKFHQIDLVPRFDIIGITMDPNTYEVKELTHLEDAFLPPQRTIGKSSFSGQGRWKHRNRVIGR